MNGPSPERKSAHTRLAAVCDLVAIRLLGIRGKLVDEPPNANDEMNVQLNSELGFDRSSPHEFAVRASFRMVARRPDDKPFVEVDCDVAASYRIREGSFDDEVIHLFARTNGLIHLWPYFRTHVQSTCGQLGIAPITIPVFRVGGPPGQPSLKEARAEKPE